MSAAARICALTGAEGYVGSILRSALEGQGWEVVALSRRIPLENAIGWSLGAGPMSPGGRSQTSQAIGAALRERGVSALVHAAWDLKLTGREQMDLVNVQGSKRLFDAAALAQISRIVFVSTISAFPGARSDYGRAKLAVERAALERGGIVIRPGLVYGRRPGGMFGALARQASGAVIPLIGSGNFPQYLVHEDDLASAVLRALTIKDIPKAPVTVAHSQPWPLRSLLERIAQLEGNEPHFIRVPWRLVYGGLRLAEAMRLQLPFRSDSVLSLVFQNPTPEWNAVLLGVEPRPFSGTADWSI